LTGPSTDPNYDDDFMDSYLSGRSILIRPHGSVDWAHVANRSRAEPSVLIAEADSYSLKPGWIRPWKGAQRPDAEVPAIAIPTRGKLDFECPPEHITVLTRLLPEVTHVVTISWRAQEEAFLDLCREHMRPPVRVMVVSANGGEADAVAKHLDLELSPLFPTAQGSRVEGFSNLILAGWRELEAFGKS